MKGIRYKSIIRNLLVSGSLLLALSSCEEEDFDYPLVFTGDVTQISATSALFSASVSTRGGQNITESGFIWGLYSKDDNGIKIINDDNESNQYSLTTNYELLPGKTYFVRAYAETENSISYGREVSFESPYDSVTNIGEWQKITNESNNYSGCNSIRSLFSLDETLYFTFGNDGGLYSFNTDTRETAQVVTNSLLAFSEFAVAYQGKGYIFNRDSFLKYNPDDGNLIELSKINQNRSRFGVSGFIIDDNIYIGLGTDPTNGDYSNEFWQYNISTDSWRQVASFPGNARRQGYSFTNNNTGYVGGGYYLGKRPFYMFNDLWSYSPESDKWLQRASLPFENDELFDLMGVNNLENGYCFYKKRFYEYNSVFNTWEKMKYLETEKNLCLPNLVSSGNQIYLMEVRNYRDQFELNVWAYDK